MITDKVGGSSAKPEVSKQSKEKRLKHKVSGYKSQSKRRSIAGCRLLLRTLCGAHILILGTWKIGSLSNDEGDGNKKFKKVADFKVCWTFQKLVAFPRRKEKNESNKKSAFEVLQCASHVINILETQGGMVMESYITCYMFWEPSGCKENHFYSLPFGQAEANIY